MKPPYPSDLEAKGWSLDLDYERIDQSDTWAIASAEQRPWLLMLWLVSWRQVPVASLPDNHKLIAARLCMPLEQLEQWADVLLSGWEKAEDGRLYHKTLTQHVLRMAAKRDKDRARVASFRAKQEKTRVSSEELEESNGAVTRYTTATHDEPTRDQHVSSTPTPTPTPKKEPPLTPRRRGNVTDFPPGFDSVWEAYPRKVGKASAAKAFARIRPDQTLIERILSAIRQQKRSVQWVRDDGRFIPHLATWLNSGRWDDEPDGKPVQNFGNGVVL